MRKRYPFLRALFIFFRSWIIAVIALLILYFAWLRDWQMTWGATAEEVSRYMAGDELLEDPELNATRAVEIEAPPEQVWPWLVQMGWKKAGLYSFGRLDNGGMPSAERIIPEWQNLKVGDSILPSLKVVEMEPNRYMLWVFQERAGPWKNATWSWGLYETDSGHTRLVARLRQHYTLNSLPEIITWALVDPMEIFMMRTTLRGIKRRAESN
jgi:hypothetical protein